MVKKVERFDLPNYTIDKFVDHAGIDCQRDSTKFKITYSIVLPLLGKTLKFKYNNALTDFLLRQYDKYSEFLNTLSDKYDR